MLKAINNISTCDGQAGSALPQINPDWAELPIFDRRGWQRLSFGTFADSINERVDPANAQDEIYIGLDDLDYGSLHIRRWGKGSDVIGTKLRFRKGDIIFGRRRAYQRKLAVADMDGICSAHAMVVRAKSGIVLPEFLPFLMMSDKFMNRAVEISVGSLSPTINWTTLKKEEFDLPPLDQQRRIAEILWAVDELLVRIRINQLAADLYRSVLVEEQFSAENSVKIKLTDLCGDKGIRIGPFGSQLHASDYIEYGIPVVMPTNLGSDEIVTEDIKRITPKKANELAIHKLELGDILLPRRGDLRKLGFVRSGQSGWICGTGSIRVRLPLANSRRLLFYALSRPSVTEWLYRNAVGTTMPNLNSSIVGNIEVSWPQHPDLVENLIGGADMLIRRLEDYKTVLTKLLECIINQVI